MRLNETSEEKENILIYALLFVVLGAGIAAGSIYLARGWGDMGAGIKDYLSGFFSALPEKSDSMTIFKTSLITNLITLAFIFVMGFFKFGFVGTGAVIIRKGFVMGFTSASFIRTYGAKGILVMLSSAPTVLIFVPAMLLFSSVSVGYSMTGNKIQKNYLIRYIFLMIIVMSIFCAASLSEGFLTTTFMKWLSPKLN